MNLKVTHFRMHPKTGTARASVRLVDVGITIHGVICAYDHTGRFHVRFPTRWVYAGSSHCEKPCAAFDSTEAESAFSDAVRLALPAFRPAVRDTSPALPSPDTPPAFSVHITEIHSHGKP